MKPAGRSPHSCSPANASGWRRAPSFSPSKADELVDACRRSTTDQEAFRQLYELHFPKVHSVCARVTGNSADALDATQETFLRAFRKLGKFRFRSSFSSWLYRIAYNTAVEIVRSRRRVESRERSISPADLNQPSFVDSRTAPVLTTLVREEEAQLVHVVVDGLSETLSATAAMRHLDGLSYEEIGVRQGIPLGTVRSRLSRAYESLRAQLLATRALAS